MRHLLYLVSRAGLLHLHTYHDVQVLGLLAGLHVPHAVGVEARVVGVLHIVAGMMPVGLGIHAAGHEVGVKLVREVVLALQVYHGPRLTFLINKV